MSSFAALPSLDSGITVESPEGIEFTLFPAGPLIRGCAWGIDKVIQWILLLIFTIVSQFFNGEGGGWILLLLIFCVDWFYHTLWEIFCRGQSPGKLLLGLRVLRSDGSPVNPGASFLRNLLRFADTFLFLCPVALISMLLSRGFRRLGDWTGGTLVVYTAQSLSISALPRGGAEESFLSLGGNVPAGGPGVLSGEEKQGILMFVRRYPLLGRARAGEIAAPFVRSLQGPDEDGYEPEEPGELGGLEELAPGEAADYLLGIGKRLAGDG
jgi:uncharacterized RDD family membrane protein YckC